MDNHHLICCMSRSIFVALGLYLYNSPTAILFCIRPSILRIKQTRLHHSVQHIAYDLDCPFPALMKLELHSSYALPAPKPRPTKAGHARRLKMRTEKTTPKDRPRDERMRRDERQRSHYRARSAQTLNFALTRSTWLGARGELLSLTFSFSSVSETGLLGRVTTGGGGIEVSGIFAASLQIN